MSKEKLVGLIFAFILSSHSAITSTTSVDVQSWECSSELSTYTDSFCDIKGEIKGCFYLALFGQYKSCAGVCNGVQVDSLTDEPRCRKDCPNYLKEDGGCVRVSKGASSPAPPASSTSPPKPNIGLIIGVVVAVLVAAWAAVGAIIFVIDKIKTELFPRRPDPDTSHTTQNGNAMDLVSNDDTSSNQNLTDAEVENPANYPTQESNVDVDCNPSLDCDQLRVNMDGRSNLEENSTTANDSEQDPLLGTTLVADNLSTSNATRRSPSQADSEHHGTQSHSETPPS